MLIQQQTVFGFPNGNCFSTCVASLLDLPTESVPNFCSVEPVEDWFEFANRWVQQYGFRLVDIKSLGEMVALPGLKFIASGLSPRGQGDHSVIVEVNEAMDFAVLMDPHPDGDGLAAPFTSACFLVKA